MGAWNLKQTKAKCRKLLQPEALACIDHASAGTNPLAINPAGEIAGWYYDAGFIQRGFLRIPAHPDE
jgi:hypothetical protein